MSEQTERLAAILRDSGRIVFFGGAGLSTESGIPDFRSADGVFKATREFGYPPETLLSHSFYRRHPEIFFRYYRKYLLYPDARPNAAHEALARLEWGSSYLSGNSPRGKLTAVVTQNIDDLHRTAGSRTVYELHGSVKRNHCERCGGFFDMEQVIGRIDSAEDSIPRCDCGGIIKPDVVLYEEGLDTDTLTASVEAIAEADTLIVGGTSLNVYPAAGLCDYFRGRSLVVINLSATAKELGATLTIREPIGRVLKETLSVLSPNGLDR